MKLKRLSNSLIVFTFFIAALGGENLHRLSHHFAEEFKHHTHSLHCLTDALNEVPADEEDLSTIPKVKQEGCALLQVLHVAPRFANHSPVYDLIINNSFEELVYLNSEDRIFKNLLLKYNHPSTGPPHVS